MRNVFAFRVKVVDYHICIAFVTGSKNDDFKMLAELAKALSSIRPDIESCLDTGVIREAYLNHNIIRHIH